MTLGNAVTFLEEKGIVSLERIFGIGGECDKATARALGLAIIKTSLGRHEADALTLCDRDVAGNRARFAWQIVLPVSDRSSGRAENPDFRVCSVRISRRRSRDEPVASVGLQVACE